MRHLIFIAGLVFLALPVRAQGILPNSFAGWMLATRSTLAPGAGADAGAAAAAREYGFLSGEQAAYSRGADMLTAQVYRMKDTSGAYGEYSYLRTADMPRADLTAHSAMSRARALALTGNLVLDISGQNLPALVPELKTLVAAAGQHAEQGGYPELTQYLPREDFVERSDRYILGPETLDQLFPVALGGGLGFSNGAEAEVGRYRVENANLTLLVADFPTPQGAAIQLASLGKKFDVNGSQPGAGQPLFAKRSVTLLVIVAGANTQAQADKLLNRVRSEAEVTWNEPTFQFREPTIGTMIVGTIIGTFTICGFAIIASLAFGGVRLMVKRVLPGRVFDRPAEVQVLQLGLCSKPINAEDFYSFGPREKKRPKV